MKRWFWAHPIGKRTGFAALAVVMFLASVFVLVTTVVGNDAINLLHNNLGNEFQKRANYCAYAAVQECLVGMDKGTSYVEASNLYVTSWNTTSPTIVNVTLPGDPECAYTVVADNNSAGALGTAYNDPTDGTFVPVGLIYLRVTATCSPSSALGGRTYIANVASLGFVGNVYWQHAIMGSNSVTLTNNVTIDSFYSNDTLPYSPATAHSHARVATNAISRSASSGLTLATNATIKGNLYWGPGVDASAVLVADGSCNVTGTEAADTGLYHIPRFTPPFNPVNSTLAVNLTPGQTLLLPPGGYKSASVPSGAVLQLQTKNYSEVTPMANCTQYYFDNSININGGSIQLVPTDTPVSSSRVEVYVGNSVMLSNGASVNPWVDSADSRPSRMQLIFVGNGQPGLTQQFTVDNSQYWGVALGSGLQFTASNASQVFGGIRAFDAKVLNNAAVHWDSIITTEDNRIHGHVAWTLKGLVTEGYTGEVDIGVGDSGG